VDADDCGKDRRGPRVIEIVSDPNLRNHFGLRDGDVVEISVRSSSVYSP
jgi:hypothetical protein